MEEIFQNWLFVKRELEIFKAEDYSLETKKIISSKITWKRFGWFGKICEKMREIVDFDSGPSPLKKKRRETIELDDSMAFFEENDKIWRRNWSNKEAKNLHSSVGEKLRANDFESSWLEKKNRSWKDYLNETISVAERAAMKGKTLIKYSSI